MSSQWDNFLRNLGEWRGSFASLDANGAVVESTASILTLEQGEDERLVHFRLRRFADGDLNGEPSRDMSEDYRNLGRQVVFFESGTFCKGRLQVAPGTPFGGEFGFICGDRRHRLVQLHNDDGGFANLVLIREFRAGSNAQELPALTPDQLLGSWSGMAATITADWPEPDQAACRFEVSATTPGSLHIQTNLGGQSESVEAGNTDPLLQLTWMADGGYHLTPRHVDHRSAFAVEAGWLSAPDRLERLIRRYDASGAWTSATQIIATRD
ncbi:DUF3598 family protein [Synechococcus sp. HK05]|uniref:DUF3598 family protein n=1 Tax=Synechococcus sp. HK05 TaxID=2725975 RepID=UPI001C387DAE|nr:DUF3598 family protein [Synechococcus sp. HK05]MBV2350880.1 DUF3598 family protein [Synechococcus sp. HK05]